MPVFTKARCVAEHHPKLLEATMRRRALLRIATLPAIAWPVARGVMRPVSFDLLRDFAQVAMFATNSQLILVRKSLEVANLAEFLAWVRANPGKVTDGGGGYGTVAHTSVLYFMQLSGTTVQFVPYRGASAALQDLLAGQIDMMIDQPSNSLPQGLAGKVKALAVTARARLPAAPDSPTTDGAGLPGSYTTLVH